MPKQLSPEMKSARHDQIIGWMADGKTESWMGRKLGLSRERVRQIITDEMGFHGYKSYRLLTKVTKSKMDKIINLLNKSLTIGEAARKLGWSSLRLNTFVRRFRIEDMLALNFKHMPGFPEMTLAQRRGIWNRVKKTYECWIWIGAMMKKIPVYRTSKGKTYFIRRVMYQLFVGNISKSKKLYNNCGNSRCCNPAHHSISEVKL